MLDLSTFAEHRWTPEFVILPHCTLHHTVQPKLVFPFHNAPIWVVRCSKATGSRANKQASVDRATDCGRSVDLTVADDVSLVQDKTSDRTPQHAAGTPREYCVIGSCALLVDRDLVPFVVMVPSPGLKAEAMWCIVWLSGEGCVSSGLNQGRKKLGFNVELHIAAASSSMPLSPRRC